MKRRVVSLFLTVVLTASTIFNAVIPATAATPQTNAENPQVQREGNLNYFSNQGKLNTKAFVQLPMGAVNAKGWLLEQLYLQKNGLTGAINDEYPLYGPANGWRGGTGDGWEKGPYYLRGLMSLAWVLDDDELKEKSMEWINFILDSQRSNGFMGPVNDGDGSSDGWDWWPRMVILQVIRDYYEATALQGTPDERVLPFFENYFRYQLNRLPQKPLTSWAASRGGDNIEVLLWYYNHAYDEQNPTESDWIIELAELLAGQTKSQDSGLNWNDVFTETTVREHVVNTTQAMKTPAVLSQLPGRENDKDSLKEGIFNMGLDHGRVDKLANSDEAARDNLPYRGAELCSIVESLLSNEISIAITGESWLGDDMERIAYNSLPAGYTPDYNGHCYFQAQNQVMATHGNHEFDCDHGDDSAFGAPTGFECCFPNMHMGWPKFVQNMWMATKDNGLALVMYGPNTVTAKVADGKTAVFDETTDYPFKDTIGLDYSGDEASFPLSLRLPAWCENPVVEVNGKGVDISQADGFAVIDRTWKPGDQVTVTFPMEVRTSVWYNNAAAVEYGPLIFSQRIEEDWRIASDDAARDIQYDPVGEFDRKEVYPASDWNYGLVIDPQDPESSIQIEYADEIGLQPFTLSNAPITMKVTGQKIPQWKLKGNVVPEPPFSPIISDESLQEEIQLVPYGCTRLHMTQLPVVGDPIESGITSKTQQDSQSYQENGEKVVEFDNVVVHSADDYTLKIYYTGSGTLRLNINGKYEEQMEFNGTEPNIVENLSSIVPGKNQYFYFKHENYNNIRFFGNDNVNITGIDVVPVNLFTQPEIKEAISNKNGTSVTLNTNIDRSSGFYTVKYGTESGNYTKTAENFYSKKAVITGLEPGETYYFQVSMLVNGAEKVSEEVKAESASTQPLTFKDDFSDPAASKNKWTIYDPNHVINFQPGKMSVGVSDNVKAMTGMQEWTDYAVVADVIGTGNPDRDFGIILRATDVTDGSDGYNGYYVGINAVAGGLNIGYADGGWNGIATPGGVAYEENKVYQLKTIIAGERLAVYVDGVKLYDQNISEMKSGNKPVPYYASGSAGLRSWKQSFDVNSFEVREITAEEYEDLGIENNLFEDDFTNTEESLAKWTVLDPKDAVSFEGGQIGVGNSDNLKIMAGTGEETWEDYAIETKLSGPENPNRDFGVMFRCTDVTAENADSYKGYYVGIDAIGNGLNVGYANNGWNDIAKVPAFTYEPGKVYDLKILVKGSMFKVFIDGVQVYELEDDKFSYGSVGLRSWKQPFTVNYFKVRNLTKAETDSFTSEKPDPGPPVQVTPDFQDDFEDALASAQKWRLCGSIDKIHFADGKLSMESNNNVKAVAGEEAWTDYVAEADVILEGKSNQNAGLMYRVTGAGNNGSDNYCGYFFGIGNNNDGTGYYISGYADNKWHQTERKNLPAFENGRAYRLKAVAYEDMVALYIDNQLITRFVNTRFPNGMIGLRSYEKSFSADQVVVREVTADDLTVFDEWTRYIDETFSAHKTVQIKFPKFSPTKAYKIVYGTQPGVYTTEVYGLLHSNSGSKSDKLSVSVPDNDTDYYFRVIALDGNEEIAASGETVIHTGERYDITQDLDNLKESLTVAGNIDRNAYTQDSMLRLDWAVANANRVLDNQNSNLIDARLAKNCIAVGINELMETEKPIVVLDHITVKPPVKTDYFTAEDPDLKGMEVTAVYSNQTEKKLTAEEYRMTGFDTTTPGEKTVTVIYEEGAISKKGEFKITVHEIPVPEKPDTTLLSALYQKIAAIGQGNYTAESYRNLQTALTAANKVLQNENAAQNEINQAADDLLLAFTKLEKTTPVVPETVDKGKLQMIYDTLKNTKYNNYTAESWNNFQTALASAQRVLTDTKATNSQVSSAFDTLWKTSRNLTQNPPKPPVTPSLKKGAAYTYKGLKYKVTNAVKGKETVSVTGAQKKSITSITIPSTVTLKGVKCKVTYIKSKAFKDYGKLTKVTIGSNISNIGSQAFYNDGKLKTITIRSNVLTKAGSKIFRGISANAKIKVPKAKRNSYKKLLKNKGQKSTVKFIW